MSVIWVELCAGGAATTLRLLGGPRATPVVSWMGGKRRQASAILAAMGLEPRQRVESVLLADPGPWGWVWPALLDPESAAQVCAVLRKWEAEDPRDLWARLAAAEPPTDLGERTAGWLWLQARSASGVPLWWSDARWEQASEAGRPPQPAGQRGAHHSGTGLIHPATVANRIEAIADVVATWLVLQAGNYIGKPVTMEGGRWHTDGFARPSIAARSKSGSCFSVPRLRGAVEGLPIAPGWQVFHGDAMEIPPVAGAYVYIDPPYRGRTGYGWDLAREQVIALARRWSGAGCVVAVSEAEPLDMGWHVVDLGPCGRKGAGPEFLTMNREPAAIPARQLPMWGAA